MKKIFMLKTSLLLHYLNINFEKKFHKGDMYSINISQVTLIFINPFADEEVATEFYRRISILESTCMPTVTCCRYLNIFAACSTCQHTVAISLASCLFNKDQKLSSSDY